MEEGILKKIIRQRETKIILLVIDGLGGLPNPDKTELEAANTPNLDSLSKISSCGLSEPLGPGLTPGSGPAHISLFGYDPFKYQIGRGVLEALGIDLVLTKEDLASRGNFATLNKEGKVIDRRAGRISTEKNREICSILSENLKEVDGVKILIKTVKEHRVVVLFNGENLSQDISENDPQREGIQPLSINPLSPEAKFTSEIVNKFIQRVNEILKDKKPANTILLRGFSKKPQIPTFKERYLLSSAAIATYPMYKGLARLVGMEILHTGDTIEEEIKTLKRNYSNYDFFYLHIKKTDSFGEDGNFKDKVKVIEEVDRFIPQILDLKPDVLVVTGDHSTPSLLKGHSWHPNPFLLYSKYCQPDGLKSFSEKECRKGNLGIFLAREAMSLILANGLRLTKFGA